MTIFGPEFSLRGRSPCAGRANGRILRLHQPLSFLLAECDTVLVAAEIYDRSIPVVQLSATDLDRTGSER